MSNNGEFEIIVDDEPITLLGFSMWYSIVKDLMLLTKTKYEGDHITLLFYHIDDENPDSKQLLTKIISIIEYNKKLPVLPMNIIEFIKLNGKVGYTIKDGIQYKLERLKNDT